MPFIGQFFQCVKTAVVYTTTHNTMQIYAPFLLACIISTVMSTMKKISHKLCTMT